MNHLSRLTGPWLLLPALMLIGLAAPARALGGQVVLFTVLLTGVLVINQAAPLGRVRVERRVGPGPYRADSPIAVSLSIRAPRLWPWLPIVVEDHLPPGYVTDPPARRLLFPSPGQTVTTDYRILAPRRGILPLDRVTVSIGDVFGLAVRTRTIALPLRLVVWPAVAPLPRQQTAIGSGEPFGEGSSLWTPDNPDWPAGVRDYRPHDPASRIHWKLSAKAGRLRVRESTHPLPRTPMRIVLDHDRYFSPADWERALSVVAALIEAAYAAGRHVWFVSLAHPGPPQMSYTRQMDALAAWAHCPEAPDLSAALGGPEPAATLWVTSLSSPGPPRVGGTVLAVDGANRIETRESAP